MLDALENNPTTSADNTKTRSAPKELECMSEEEIQTCLHHPDSHFPSICPCDTPNTSNSKTMFSPYELHCLTGCCRFWNYQHIISTSKGGILCNTGKIPLSLSAYATTPKAACGKPIDKLPCKYLDIVHLDIAFADCVSVGGYKFALIFVDWATQYNWTFGLKSQYPGRICCLLCQGWFLHSSIPLQLQQEVIWQCHTLLSPYQQLIHCGEPGRLPICQWVSRIPLEYHGPHVPGISHGKANALDFLVLCHQARSSDDEYDPREVS
jgi:hypothetical protein